MLFFPTGEADQGSRMVSGIASLPPIPSLYERSFARAWPSGALRVQKRVCDWQSDA
jgi:hypothetical protein